MSLDVNFNFRIILAGLFGAVAFTAMPAHAAVLTSAGVQDTHRLLILESTFDPVTSEQIERAEALRVKANAEKVLFLPTSKPGQIALPLRERLHLTELALKDETNLLALGADFSETKDVVKKLRLQNPKMEIRTLEKASSEMRKMDESSKQALKTLHENFEIYFSKGDEPGSQQAWTEVAAKLPPAELKRIRENGLYLDRSVGQRISPLQHVIGNIEKLYFSKAGGTYSAIVKPLLVNLVAKPNLREVKIGGEAIQIKKYLGSGLKGDAYLVDYRGLAAVVKISRGEAGRQDLLAGIPVQLWDAQRLGMNVPRVIDYDPEGRWSISEFIQGETVAKYIQLHGKLPENLRNSIRELYSKAYELSLKSHVIADFAPDNIVIRDGQAYLVDVGYLSSSRATLPGDVNALLNDWESSAADHRARCASVHAS